MYSVLKKCATSNCKTKKKYYWCQQHLNARTETWHLLVYKCVFEVMYVIYTLTTDSLVSCVCDEGWLRPEVINNTI